MKENEVWKEGRKFWKDEAKLCRHEVALGKSSQPAGTRLGKGS